VAAVDAGASTILFRHPGHYAGRPLPLGNPGTALVQAKGFDGVERVYRAVTAPGLGWHVYAGTPVSVAFAPAHRTVSQSVALTVVVFCMLAFLAVYLSRRLVRPADTALAERVADLAEARSELQRALVRFTEMQEEERRTIAQAVHDDTIQALIATMWALDDLDTTETSPHAAEVIDRVRANLGRAVAAARTLLFELRPPALDELGLTAAVGQQLEHLEEETGATVKLDSDVRGHLPVHLETLAFRTAQEALRNVRQHAAARTASVTIRRYDDHVRVEVDDDGVGVSPADLAAGPTRAGIVAMRETIGMYGGSFSIGPGPTGGTRVAFSLPLPPG
jgi:signal transduction histidine kinase